MIEKTAHPEGEGKKGDLTKSAGLIPVDSARVKSPFSG
jgi:hypothetical protein